MKKSMNKFICDHIDCGHEILLFTGSDLPNGWIRIRMAVADENIDTVNGLEIKTEFKELISIGEQSMGGVYAREVKWGRLIHFCSIECLSNDLTGRLLSAGANNKANAAKKTCACGAIRIKENQNG